MTEEQLKKSLKELESVKLPNSNFLWQEQYSPKELMELDVVMDSINPELLLLEDYVFETRNKYTQKLEDLEEFKITF